MIRPPQKERPSGSRRYARSGAHPQSSVNPPSAGGGFTLLEVMIALGVLGIALLALLALHHQNLQSVIRAQDLSRAAMLAQGLMSEAEVERFPNPGVTSGNFERLYPRLYPYFHWRRAVEASPMFPDLRTVEITVFYGPRFRRSFTLTEFLHNPQPPGALLSGPGPTGPQPMPPPPQ